MAGKQHLDMSRTVVTIPSLVVATKEALLDVMEDKDKMSDYLDKQEESALDEGPSEDKCSEDVDWEMIADYLSRCQSEESTPSETPPVVLPVLKVQRPAPKLHNSNPYLPNRGLLSRRSAANNPPSMSKGLSAAQATTMAATVSPTPTPESGLSTGAKAGIASVAAVSIVFILVGLATFHTRRRRKYGYARTKSRDGAAELEGRFTVTTWPERRDSSPMIHDRRRPSDGDVVGLGIERPGGLISPGLSTGGHTPVMSYPEYNVSAASQNHYEATPNISYASDTPLISQQKQTGYTPPAQAYVSPLIPSQKRSPEQTQHTHQHNQRSRNNPSLSMLSEAIPPPPIQTHKRNSMADYQIAVPLGFANGFVQVERTSPMESATELAEARQAEPSWEPSWQHGDDVMHQRVPLVVVPERDSTRDIADGPDGDPQLPSYAETEMEGLRQVAGEVEKVKHREVVRYDTSTGHYHIDSESESDDDESGGRRGERRSRRKSFTKEELG